MNFILRPLYQRPEMLRLSIDSEIAAREHHCGTHLHTLFLVEYGADPICLEIISKYPYPHTVIKRSTRMNPVGNILEGLKAAAMAEVNGGDVVPEYAINIEEDCFLHESFFTFVEKATSMLSDRKYSAITTWGKSNEGASDVLTTGTYFCGPGTIVNLDFFRRYVMPYATQDYYRDFYSSIMPVNYRNHENPYSKYHSKYGNQYQHLDWDGLTNRLVDAALFEEGINSYSSECFRLLHIGFYGFNRHGGKFPKELKSFESRVDFLKRSIFDSDFMASLDGHYKDYAVFSEAMETWNGELHIT